MGKKEKQRKEREREYGHSIKKQFLCGLAKGKEESQNKSCDFCKFGEERGDEIEKEKENDTHSAIGNVDPNILKSVNFVNSFCFSFNNIFSQQEWERDREKDKD